MIHNKTITLVVPCKNEARIIRSFIKRVPSYVDEILVVDNNSHDGTARIAKRAGAVVLRERRSVNGVGYGFAHQTGIAKATGDYIVAVDGDDTYPVESIKTIINYMEKYGLDIVSCNRLPLVNTHAISWIRKLGIHLLNIEVRLLYGKRISDILTGMWVGKREALKELNLTNGDWNLSPEVKLAAMTSPGVHFSEYHIRHFARTQNVSKQRILATGIAHALYIVKRRFTIDNPLLFLITSYEKT